jgi:PAS domain S-box-containing protein
LTRISLLDLSSVLDTVDVGIIVLDRDESIVEWNDWMARVARQPRTSTLGRNLFEIFPNLRHGRLPSVIRDAFEVGSASLLTHSLNALLPLRGETGAELLHNVVVRPVVSHDTTFCLLQITDVTVPVTRERVLRERQNARYHAIVDSAPDAIITTSLDRTIQWVNGAGEHVFGYASTELLGQKIDILLGEGASLASAFLGDALDSAETARALQVVGRRKSGLLEHFDVSFGRWKADERVLVTTIWRNVTERIVAETALRESEGRHRALLEAVPQLVWTCGPDGSFDYFNPQWQAYTGAMPGEQLANSWLEVIHEQDRPGLEAAWNASLTGGSVFDIDARLRHASGDYRWFKLRAIPVRSAAGTITRWFGTATDITDLVDAKAALLRSNEELEGRIAERTRERELVLGQLHESQKMESIGQLTGGMAHDFNNLLAVILGSLSLLRKRVPQEPQMLRLIEGAIQGAERGATLTKRLLAFARRQELKLEAVEVQRLIPDMLDFLRQSVGANILIRTDILADVEPVRIDANQLELALMNLAVNARDAMPRGGRLTITCRNESFGAGHEPLASLPPGEYVRISVADTGEGMSEATRLKAMEPFFTTKGIGKGTGLGLSMVHGLTAQSGGGMHIASQLGEGTVVSLWLPRASRSDLPKPVPQPGIAAAPSSARRLNVLLVDDDLLVSTNTVYMLMDLGHSVVDVSSGAQALQRLQSGQDFDVVVTDFAMPNMNGLDLATRIKRNWPNLPIILATGYAELAPQATVEFYRLAKPYSQKALAEALEAVFEKVSAPA